MSPVLPWYKQFWPWFIFGLPACVVVAGLSTWWIAENNADHLVADDYYKEGLAINQQLKKQRLAEKLGIQASISIEPPRVQVDLTAPDSPAVLSTALQLHLSHPVDADQDFDLRLAQTHPGIYQAAWPDTSSKRWLWRLEPLAAQEKDHWRVDGEITILSANER